MRIAQKLRNLSPYDPTVDSYAVKLDANESPFAPDSDKLKEVFENIVSARLNRYPDPTCQKLREVASRLYGVSAEQIVCGNGSDELISVIFGAFLEHNSKVLVTAPDFSMYGFYAHIAECETVTLQKNESLNFTAEDLIAKAKAENVDMVIFSNPCNPTGQGIKRDDVLKIANSLDCLIIVDEAYMDFWSESILDTVANLENVIVLKTCSKAFALAGIRLGFAVTSQELASYLNRARSPFNINTLTQAVAVALLEDANALTEASESLVRSRIQLEQLLGTVAKKYPNRVKLIETVTNFALVECDNAPLYYEELKGASICVRLIANKYLRITAGTTEENELLAKALDAALSMD